MGRSPWHRFYVSSIAAAPELLFKLVTRSFDKENVRTMAALKAYAEATR
jgi:hypothetical protein